ncbi:hypothetical protein ABID22_002329 [Pontibacter aydingkolensis]|uniref:Porin family protein n=1 Tax=Pontibacter aydingkolensis TaxID=1911536 RepID=A0ABS7CVN9_9BACT|nr:outer membrane beta-barrel protein [Pontibacter aydingkolensis]MBW7467931.1 porin family protein [Pontibacter aydingkolensis]
MKKIFFTVLCFVLVQLSFAQIPQGSWTATGTLGYTSRTEEAKSGNVELNRQSYQVSPGIGYFVTNNLELGLMAGYRYSEHDEKNSIMAGPSYTNYHEIKNYSAGVYARAYKFLVNNLAVYGQADVNYNFSDVSYKQVLSSFSKYELENKTETNYFSAAVRPGIAFFLSDKISLNATYGELSYSRNNEEQQRRELIFNETTTRDTSSESNQFQLVLSSSSFNLGLSFYF